MKNDYKMIFLDIDGTLTDSDKNIMPETLETLKRVQNQGIRLAIASGRPSKGVQPYADILELEKHDGFIMPFNGAKIVNCQTNEVMYEKTLTMDVFHRACDLAKEYGTEIITYKGDCVLSETDDNKYMLIEATINKMDVIKVDSIKDELDSPPVKCLILGDGDYLASVEDEIREKIGPEANVFRSEPFFLEVVPKGIDKAAAIDSLIAKLGVKQSETIAFGDGYNDISMIKYAGLGVAMSNGCDEIRAAADRIAPDNNSNGIAVVLNEIFQEM